jgi:acetolactate synthase-1/2/3 large subunit
MEPRARALLAEADLLIVLGSALDGMTTAHWSLPRPTRVLDVNLRPTGALAPDLSINADVASFTDAVLLRLSGRPPWADSPFRIRDDVRHDAIGDSRTQDAAMLVDAVERAWPSDNAIVCDMAVAGYWVGGYAATMHPRRLLYPVGWGTLGYGLPAALGVAAAGIPTLAVVGDGGVAMGIGELATLGQHHLPVTLLIVDDGGYGMLRFDQQQAGHAQRGVSLDGPDWESLAAAYRLPLRWAPDAESLRDALAEAAVSGQPRLIVQRTTLFPPRSTSPRWADPAR